MSGSFSEESLRKYTELVSEEVGVDFSETESVYDFTRCVRPNGTSYGTRGKCRKGTEEAKEEKEPKPKRQPRQPKTEVKKEEAPVEKKKPEGSVYTVRGSDKKSAGLVGRIKDKIKKKLGGGKVDLEDYGSEEKLAQTKEQTLARLRKHGVAKSQQKKAEKYWSRLESAASENRAFAERLSGSLPKGFKPTFDADEGVQLTKKTKSGDTVQVTYSPSQGFHFRVNGTVEAGSVKDRKAQVEVAMSVRDAYNSVVRALPVGAVLKTSAYDGDDKGAGRESAYVRMGFSRPEKSGGDMYSVKQEGDRMAPASREQYEKQEDQKGFMWFAEGNKIDEIRVWLQAVFGIELS